MSRLGADAGGLEDLASRFKAEAASLGESLREVDAAMSSTFWKGQDANKFRSSWDVETAEFRLAMRSLESIGRELNRQASQQRAASGERRVGARFNAVMRRSRNAGQERRPVAQARPAPRSAGYGQLPADRAIGDRLEQASMAAQATTSQPFSTAVPTGGSGSPNFDPRPLVAPSGDPAAVPSGGTSVGLATLTDQGVGKWLAETGRVAEGLSPIVDAAERIIEAPGRFIEDAEKAFAGDLRLPGADQVGELLGIGSDEWSTRAGFEAGVSKSISATDSASWGSYEAGASAFAGVKGEATASAGIVGDQLHADATASGQVGVEAEAYVEAELLGVAEVDAKAEAMAGAEGEASVGVGVGADGIDVDASVGGHAGVSAEASVDAEVLGGVAEVGASVGARAGVGFNLDVGGSLTWEKVGFSLDFGAALGLGFNLSLNLYFNPKKILAEVVNLLESIGGAAGQLGKTVLDGLKYVADGIKYVALAGLNVIKKVGKAIVGGVKSIGRKIGRLFKRKRRRWFR